MAKHYSTVVEDIYSLFEDDRKGVAFSKENVQAFGQKLAEHIANRINEERQPFRLRFSNLGTDCNRKLWYKEHEPEKAERLSTRTRFKFLYGDILEELVLFLAKEAGHTVKGEQDELTYDGVSGRRDGVLDGLPIDVKSASSRSLDKFKDRLQEDPFGYRVQLGGYEKASEKDPLVTEKGSAFLVVDKTTGELYLSVHEDLGDIDLKDRIKEKREALAAKEPPERFYMPVPEGKSGNLKLGVQCSYCEFKQHCWPNLRTFVYAKGPVFLTHVAREPKVGEKNE
jgi:hypothetical protein